MYRKLKLNGFIGRTKELPKNEIFYKTFIYFLIGFDGGVLGMALFHMIICEIVVMTKY